MFILLSWATWTTLKRLLWSANVFLVRTFLGAPWGLFLTLSLSSNLWIHSKIRLRESIARLGTLNWCLKRRCVQVMDLVSYWKRRAAVLCSYTPPPRCDCTGFQLLSCVISSVCCEIDETRVPLCYYATSSCKRPLRMGPIRCPETSVSSYHYSLRNDPEERSSQLLSRLQCCCTS